MGKRYEIKASISRDKAVELLERLRDDDDFRAAFEESPRSILFEYRIDLSPESLPETVMLPSPDAIGTLLATAEEIVPPSASPFGLLVLFVVFGAMPMVTAADGTG